MSGKASSSTMSIWRFSRPCPSISNQFCNLPMLPVGENRRYSTCNGNRSTWAWGVKRIGKPGLLFHDLRRSGIRNMIRAGIPERVAMAISGHKTRSVFDRYNIVSQEDLMQAAKKRQAFTRDQSARLQNGYNRPREIKKATTLKAVTT